MAWFDPPTQTADPVERVLFGAEDPNIEVQPIDFGSLVEARTPRAAPEAATAEVLELSEISEAEQIDWDAKIQEAQDLVREQAESELEDRLRDALQEQRQLQERRWLAALDVLAQWQADRTQEMSHAVLELSGAIAAHFVGREVERDEAAYQVIVEEAMRRAFEYDALRLHVPEGAVQGLESRLTSLRRRHPQHTSLTIVGDETLGPGDCAIVSQGVRVEGILEQRVAQLVDTARSALEHEHELTPPAMTARDLSDEIDAFDGRGLADEMLSEPTETQE